MSYGYFLMYDWSFESPTWAVWDLIAKTEARPEWWPGVQDAQLLAPGDTDGIGARHRIEWRTPLPIPFRLDMRVTEIEHHRAIKSVTTGDYEIEESWYFFPQLRGVDVRHSWFILFTHGWMQAIPRLENRVLRAYSRRMAAGLQEAKARLGETRT